jgi:iron(III) transport system substrate-binding protein
MITIRKAFGAVAVTALLAGFGLGVQPAAAQTNQGQPLTANEKLYEELFKLSPEERMKRIEEGAKKEAILETLPNYTGRLEHLHTEVFRKRYPFLKVNISDLNSYDSLERMISEERVGKHLTDSTGFSLPDYWVIKDKNIVARYPTPAVKNVLPQYRGFLSDEHLWIPQSITEHGISYNTKMIKPEDAPKDWMDMACNPKFKGQMSLDPAETKFLIGIYTMFGKDMEQYRKWIECLGKNEPIILLGHTTRTTLMIAGDHAIQGDNFFYAWEAQKAKNPAKVPIAGVYNAPLPMFCGAVLINKNAVHPYAAALYSDWILSEESQQFLFDEYRGPITRQHPFLKPDANLVVFSYEDPAIAEKLVDIWKQYVGTKKG